MRGNFSSARGPHGHPPGHGSSAPTRALRAFLYSLFTVFIFEAKKSFFHRKMQMKNRCQTPCRERHVRARALSARRPRARRGLQQCKLRSVPAPALRYGGRAPAVLCSADAILQAVAAAGPGSVDSFFNLYASPPHRGRVPGRVRRAREPRPRLAACSRSRARVVRAATEATVPTGGAAAGLLGGPYARTLSASFLCCRKYARFVSLRTDWQ